MLPLIYTPEITTWLKYELKSALLNVACNLKELNELTPGDKRRIIVLFTIPNCDAEENRLNRKLQGFIELKFG
jgi:hypothetical protein